MVKIGETYTCGTRTGMVVRVGSERVVLSDRSGTFVAEHAELEPARTNRLDESVRRVEPNLEVMQSVRMLETMLGVGLEFGALMENDFDGMIGDPVDYDMDYFPNSYNDSYHDPVMDDYGSQDELPMAVPVVNEPDMNSSVDPVQTVPADTEPMTETDPEWFEQADSGYNWLLQNGFNQIGAEDGYTIWGRGHEQVDVRERAKPGGILGLELYWNGTGGGTRTGDLVETISGPVGYTGMVRAITDGRALIDVGGSHIVESLKRLRRIDNLLEADLPAGSTVEPIGRDEFTAMIMKYDLAPSGDDRPGTEPVTWWIDKNHKPMAVQGKKTWYRVVPRKKAAQQPVG